MAWDDHPQSARGLLYILQPTVVMAARVNMAAATYPAHEITYDGVTTGGYTSINIGQTILIGSTAGAYDLGWTYLRAAPDGDTLPIGYSSRGTRRGEVSLTDNAYITVLDTYEVWRKPQRLTEDGTLYKDYDLDGTTPPAPIMHIGDLGGLGRIGLISGGVLTVSDFDWSGSTLIGASETWLDRNWYFEDGTITSGSTTTADPVVTFPAGKRWIRLYGNGSGGGTTYRRYLVVAIDESNPGTVRFNKLKLRRTAAGQTLSADLHERLDPATYLPGTVVMLLMREKRGSTATWTQRFAGWLDIETSFAQASAMGVQKGATITAVDVAGRLAQIKALPSTVAREASQDDWLKMVDLTPDRYLHRHLAFETSALALADLTLSGSTAYPMMSFSTTGGTMYEVCDKIARAFARRLTCDSNGRLWVKLDPLRQDSGDRTATVQRHIGEADWSQIKWSPNRRASIGALRVQNMVTSTGYASVLTTPFPDVFSIAPGEIAGQGMGEQSSERGVVATHTESHARAGHDYARMTAPEAEWSIQLAHGVDADIEPANMTWVTVSAAATRSYRGPTLSTARGLPTAIDITVDAETGVSKQALTWERETVGTPGARDPLPTSTSSNLPPSTPPPTEPVGGNTGVITVTLNTRTVALFCKDKTMKITQDFDTPEAAGGPTWVSTNLAALANWSGTYLLDVVVDPYSPLYVRTGTEVNAWIVTGDTGSRILKISDIFGTPSLSDQKTITVGSGLSVSIEASRSVKNWAMMVSAGGFGVYVYYTTNGSTWSTVLVNSYIDTYGQSWASGLAINEQVAGTAYISVLDSSGNSTSGVGTAGSGMVTTDYGATWSTYSAADPDRQRYGAVVAPFCKSDVLFYGSRPSATTLWRLYKTVAGTASNISPSSGGVEYGTDNNPPNNRILAAAPLDGNFLAAILTNVATGKRGLFISRNQGSSWSELIAPVLLASFTYGGVYVVRPDLLILMGTGATPIAVSDGYGIESRAGSLSGVEVRGVIGG